MTKKSRKNPKTAEKSKTAKKPKMSEKFEMAEKPKMAEKSKRAEKPKTAIENFPAQIQKLRKHLSFKVLCRLSHVVNILF